MRSDLIPIRYIGGTGGSFICAWLTQAKLGTSDIPLSLYGNAHQAYKECPVDISPLATGQEYIDILKSVQPPTPSMPPYFVHVHCSDLDAILQVSNKVINISYQKENIKEIFFMFYGKFHLDERDSKYSDFNIRYLSYLKTMVPNFKEISSTDRVLNVSWHEISSGDPEMLAQKFFKFTGIGNLSLDILLEWRKATKIGFERTLDSLIK